jgi:uncharacterized protein with ParB-like and HNH nuclease domain
MALSLRAEQKSITDLFTSGEDVYVIPEYQRPYSWNRDTCYQLYSDITTSFIHEEDYFVGNIIMARSSKERKFPNVVDGQQRLITIWLYMKVLTVLHPDKNRLKRTLEVESVLTDNSVPRIDSKVYEHNDQDNIKTVLSYDEKDFIENWEKKSKNKNELDERMCSRIEANTLYLYHWLKEFYANLADEKKKNNFLEFFLDRVFLLPIELGGETIEEASYRALTIFETINNRGQILEDSDIFKARLYKTAKAEGRDGEFIEQWMDFNTTCSDLNIAVDDLFRYYYHILRAKEGQTTNEASLREYLTHDNNSALSVKQYKEIVEDLSKITDILQWLNAPERMEKAVARWIQLIDLYTNQYPRYALVNYLFFNGCNNDSKLEKFLRTIVRYYYYRGATLQVKYETYKINKLVASQLEISQYDCDDLTPDYFDHIGFLRNGYALLAHNLQYLDSYINHPSFDRLIANKDRKSLQSDWDDISIDEIKNNIANIVALDIPKRNINHNEKSEYYLTSNLKDVSTIFGNNKYLTYIKFKERERLLKETLMDFFIKG